MANAILNSCLFAVYILTKGKILLIYSTIHTKRDNFVTPARSRSVLKSMRIFSVQRRLELKRIIRKGSASGHFAAKPTSLVPFPYLT